MRVALVDDNENDRKRILNYLQQFQEEEGEKMQVTSYNSSLDFLEEYDGGYDVILLDIEMPGMDGMETAKEIRLIDEMAAIIFITNMAQYAIRGYEVNAIGFWVIGFRTDTGADSLAGMMPSARCITQRALWQD